MSMAETDGYSRLVLFAKITLPLVALAILSTLFLLSRDVDPEAAIPYAELDVEQIAREQRLTNARYASVTQDGAAIVVSAADARPDPNSEGQIIGRTIAAKIELAEGDRIDLTSSGGLIDLTERTAGLNQDVVLISTAGYEVRAENMTASLDRVDVFTDRQVQIQAPFGTIVAGNMRLTKGESADDGYRLVFQEKVRMLYTPLE